MAPGQDKGGILWSWQSRGRCHQRPGSGTVPSPPWPVPSSPESPPRCHIPSTRAGGCASFTPALCHGAAGMRREQQRSSQKRTGIRLEASRGTGRCSGRAPSSFHPGPGPRAQPRGSPGSPRPRRVSRSGCCSRRGSGRCTWSRPRPSSAGCQGWAGVGTSGTDREVLSVRPLCSGLGHLGTTPADPQGNTLQPCQPHPKNPDPPVRGFQGGRSGPPPRDPSPPRPMMEQGWTQ